MSSAPSVKRRLSKPKTNDNNSSLDPSRPKRSFSLSSTKSRPPPDTNHDQRNNYFDFKPRHDGPKNLKQQLKQSFPEAKRKISLDSFRRPSSDSTNSTDTMGAKDRHPNPILTTALAGSNASAKSSPTTVGTPSPLARQLSVVHEGAGIDIASAIHLLQELKKTASPEELVALHRALLPLKEEASFEEPSPPSGSQRSSRRSSKLPPGLNTRGEPGDDLLKKLGDEVRRPRMAMGHAGSQEPMTPAQRTSSSGTVKIPNIAEEDIDERSATPSEEPGYSQTGAYRSGTLRITNGAASPEPARMLQLIIPESQVEHLDQTVDSPGSPAFYPGRGVQAPVESIPGSFRVLHSDQRSTSRPLPPPPPPEAGSRRGSDASQSHTDVLDHGDDMSSPAVLSEREPEKETTPSRETHPFALSNPPQHRQPQSYRGSLTVNDTDFKIESPSVSRDSSVTIAQFASRLSTVFGEDMSDEEPLGTPNDALAKLTGEPRVLGPRQPKSVTSMKSFRSGRPSSMSLFDSGYGSTSNASSQRYTPSPNSSQEKQRPDLARTDTDNDSLYTFNEFLTAPKHQSTPPISPTAAISPASPATTKAKKDLPGFLGLREKTPTKRMSLPVSGVASNSNDSLASTLVSSVGSEQSGKTSKKLRKPMPTLERLKREKSTRVSPVSELLGEEFPLVSDEMNKSLEQRYHQPSVSDTNLNRNSVISRRASMASENQSLWDDGHRVSEDEGPAPDAVFQRRNPFARKRSVSRGRKSRDQATETPVSTEKPGRIPGFLRSLSRSRSRRRRASIDSAECKTPTGNEFDSASTRTGSTTPRPQAERDTSVEKGNESWRTGPAIKKKSKSMGMTEEMASELARSKSRDVGGHDRASTHDRPRMATPKRGHSRNQSVGPPKSGRSVEDFLPGWQSKGTSPANSPPKPSTTRRPYSMSADVPPMPDLPLDVAAKTARARKLMEKKKKDLERRKSTDAANESVDASTASPQNSATSSPAMGKVKSAVRAREEQERRLEQRMTQDDRKVERLRPVGRSTASADDINVAVRELQGSSSEQSSILELDSRPTTADRSEAATAASSVSSQEQTGFSGFEKQAALWRERRKSLGTYLPSPSQLSVEDESDASLAGPRIMSPEIVVSRYITPLGHEAVARAQANSDPTSEAARHADLYRSLLDDEDATSSGFSIPRTDSAYSSASSAVSVPKYQDLPHALTSRPPMPTQSRTVSGITTASSTYSTQYSNLPRTRSPGGRVRTPSGKFYAYEPISHASQAERSRAASLSKLNPATASRNENNSTLSPASSTDGLSTIFSDTLTISSCGGTIRAKPKNPHQRHNFPDPQYKELHSTRNRSQSKPRRPRPVSSHSSNLGDRYSGGLAWEWNRDSGFGGSAGTRLNNETGTRRKGQRLAESYGVDLGDVPIFLTESPDGVASRQQQKKGYFGA